MGGIQGLAVALPGPVQIIGMPLEINCKGHQQDRRTITPQKGEQLKLEFYPHKKGKIAKGFGQLQLITDPKTWVFIGKRKLGVTPLLGVKLPAGTHQLKLLNRQAGIDRVVEVTIEAGEVTTLQPSF